MSADELFFLHHCCTQIQAPPVESFAIPDSAGRSPNRDSPRIEYTIVKSGDIDDAVAIVAQSVPARSRRHEDDVIQGHASRGSKSMALSRSRIHRRAGGNPPAPQNLYLRYRVGDHLLQRLRYSTYQRRLVLDLDGARRKPYRIEVDVIFVALGDGQISGIAQDH